MIHIYSSEITSRLEYIFRLVFETILGDKTLFYNDVSLFNEQDEVRINYSGNTHAEGLQLHPHRLLFESNLQKQDIEISDWETLKIFFHTENSFLPFDLFAASFYLVTRYEEYLPGKRDRHGRFLSRSSLANQNRFVEKPLVNMWAWKMASEIEKSVPGITFRRTAFKYIPTIDIDNAWAFKHKGFFRGIAASLKDLAAGHPGRVKQRLMVLFRLRKDPFDTYDFIKDILTNAGFRPEFFILVNKKGKHDRSLSYKNRAFQKLILSLSEWGRVGIHPSYSSDKDVRQLTKEIDRLKSILGTHVKTSRQHFLKISLPKTYRRLIENSIGTDYSLGYASRPGFRASICTPFYFFDLIENKETSLLLVPFEVMDVTFTEYRNMTAYETTQKIKTLMRETAEVGGTFVSLWHNESLCDEGIWKGWRKVYTEMTNLAVDLSK